MMGTHIVAGPRHHVGSEAGGKAAPPPACGESCELLKYPLGQVRHVLDEGHEHIRVLAIKDNNFINGNVCQCTLASRAGALVGSWSRV